MSGNNYLIKGAKLINEGRIYQADVIVIRGKIEEISPSGISGQQAKKALVIDARGKYLLPGAIDDQVHFRDPGLTHKGNIYTESRAAVAGGVTSYMEMPNTDPQTLSQKLLEKKYQKASRDSLANYSFYMGAGNDNLAEIEKTDPARVCGIKVFMGASTGNMLVDDEETLEAIFAKAPTLVAVHCEDEPIIRQNLKAYTDRFGDEIPMHHHPDIRSAEACYKSSSKAVALAKKHGTRLHLLHLSTAKETGLLDNNLPLRDKKITAEACVHHLWFCDADYERLGTRIKWNPAIKTAADRDGLLTALKDNRIDVVATDHAPHTVEEKDNPYTKAPSGGPLVQHSLQVMVELYRQGKIKLEAIVEKMCHAPAELFRVQKRGYLREGYWADLVLLDPEKGMTVRKENIRYKCKWSPLEGQAFSSSISHTFVNGHLVWENGHINDDCPGQRLLFDR